ncbi:MULTISPECIES: hypothetical protein [unclassified Sphingobacterium]|uniref:hypothetical protein n=1 Tax=unclassified Sphingobacterium TaxID=2609468 RepID=UPI0026015A9E|nr:MULTISPECIES: hypothetical protein [unclassified Sphingobacterium]
MTKSLLLFLILILGYTCSFAQENNEKLIKSFLKDIYETETIPDTFLDHYFTQGIDPAKKEKIINNLTNLRSTIVQTIDKEKLPSLEVKSPSIKSENPNANTKPFVIPLNADYSLGFWVGDNKIKTILWLKPSDFSTTIYYDVNM